ncbi:hypothetical protein [Rhizobium sp. CSW-27]|uniref:hypothetical protein n=1 Tax=Rhizobium sp. CSW-27 TaxID=2839985 RepID=UPI001C02C38E|nr:hypothetical protein [Rhizobium sp. CSW-27]MBT9371401.1 hypothetical protein [Rhizobium sp. CSW-27]
MTRSTFAALAARATVTPSGPFARFLPALAAYASLTIAGILLLALPGAGDHVGPLSGDTLRLLQLRDLLAGQGWFDLTQYRLGPEGGTIIGLSRLVDLPIAGLIRLFAVFGQPPLAAEALALTVWPLTIATLFIAAAGFGGRQLAGMIGMHVAFGLASLYAFTSLRFYPGAIDQASVQMLVLLALAGLLIERRRSAAAHGMAGVLAALLLAIGPETAPLVAAASLGVALQWAWHGQAFGRAARAFGLGLALAVTAALVATVPPAGYGQLRCGGFSLGLVALVAPGGAGLFLATRLAGSLSRSLRLQLVGALGLALAAAALLLAPHCLAGLFSSPDPLLGDLGLAEPVETRSILAQIRLAPEVAGGFYAVGLFAIAVCVFRIRDRQQVEAHLLLGALILAGWLLSLLQLRYASFANVLSILPLSFLIADLRRLSQAEPENINAGFAYTIAALAAVPVVWVFLGTVSQKGIGRFITVSAMTRATAPLPPAGACRGASGTALLARLPSRMVAAPPESGADILRFTRHRVLAVAGPVPGADQADGRQTLLQIGLSPERQALDLLRGANVALLAFCPTDEETVAIARTHPDGLYAGLLKGNVPDDLRLVAPPKPGDLAIYAVRPR